MNEKVKAKALQTLDRMEEIVRKDRLIQGEYLAAEVDEKLRSGGAVCGGHKACLIGSLWLGYGVKPVKGVWGDWGLPGVHGQRRFVGRRPALKVAWDALDKAAQRTKAMRDEPAGAQEDDDTYENAAELLFEERLSGPLKRPVLRLIASARREVANA